MPSIRLSLSEFKDGLPLVCMLCGVPCTHRQPHTFAWHPPTANGLRALANTWRARGQVPFCRKHFHYFLRRTLIPIGCFAATLAFGFLGLILVNRLENVVPHDIPLGSMAGISFVVLLFVSGGVAGYIQWSGVHPERIDAAEIQLAGVHYRFVKAVLAMRSGESEDVSSAWPGS